MTRAVKMLRTLAQLVDARPTLVATTLLIGVLTVAAMSDHAVVQREKSFSTGEVAFVSGDRAVFVNADTVQLDRAGDATVEHAATKLRAHVAP